MLFTRCPTCGTTFRITTEALQKAEGQVRCGRCSNIFNAHANLHEQADAGTAPAAPGRQNEAPLPEAHAAPGARVEIEPFKGSTPDREGDTGARDEGEDEDDGEPIEHIVLESEVAETPAAPVIESEEDTPAEPDDDEAAALAALVAPSVWTLEDAVDETPHSRKWQIAAALAAVLLIGQVVHHYRAELARQATLGPMLQTVYAWFGETLVPRWDLDQYEVVYTGASAEPSPSGQGSLAITARIRNKGPKAQPYPHVHLTLLDRWEDAVGSRIFRPAEYLPAAIPPGTMMAAGETIDAELVVVDPGPDAYGFELDVCSESDSQLSCAADTVFK